MPAYITHMYLLFSKFTSNLPTKFIWKYQHLEILPENCKEEKKYTSTAHDACDI